MINLFYEEPDPDRWFKYDRYPRRVIRRLFRGRQQPGGVMRWFLNLKQGLDLIGAEYTVNDYKRLRARPHEWAHVIGKEHVLDKVPRGIPIMFGPGVPSHPSVIENWDDLNIQHLVISCEWFAKGCYGNVEQPISIWPAGIETDLWRPSPSKTRSRKVIIYDKVRWERERYVPELVDPIVERVRAEGLEPIIITYGDYREEDFRAAVGEAEAMVFLCEHETQGFAYLQTLSCDVPIFAWDRGGLWRDPSFYPEIRVGPVTSVPYWDERCGMKFEDAEQFSSGFSRFWRGVESGGFAPRDYVVQNLTLEKCAREYVNLCELVRRVHLSA